MGRRRLILKGVFSCMQFRKQYGDVSEQLSEFLQFIRDAEQAYTEAFDGVNLEDKATCDLLHVLELGNITYKERNRVATQLANSRKNRRYYKDLRDELEPLHKYYTENKKVFNMLSEVLGATRKQEKAHTDRNYKPRAISLDGIVR